MYHECLNCGADYEHAAMEIICRHDLRCLNCGTYSGFHDRDGEPRDPDNTYTESNVRAHAKLRVSAWAPAGGAI